MDVKAPVPSITRQRRNASPRTPWWSSIENLSTPPLNKFSLENLHVPQQRQGKNPIGLNSSLNPKRGVPGHSAESSQPKQNDQTSQMCSTKEEEGSSSLIDTTFKVEAIPSALATPGPGLAHTGPQFIDQKSHEVQGLQGQSIRPRRATAELAILRCRGDRRAAPIDLFAPRGQAMMLLGSPPPSVSFEKEPANSSMSMIAAEARKERNPMKVKAKKRRTRMELAAATLVLMPDNRKALGKVPQAQKPVAKLPATLEAICTSDSGHKFPSPSLALLADAAEILSKSQGKAKPGSNLKQLHQSSGSGRRPASIHKDGSILRVNNSNTKQRIKKDKSRKHTSVEAPKELLLTSSQIMMAMQAAAKAVENQTLISDTSLIV